MQMYVDLKHSSEQGKDAARSIYKSTKFPVPCSDLCVYFVTPDQREEGRERECLGCCSSNEDQVVRRPSASGESTVKWRSLYAR